VLLARSQRNKIIDSSKFFFLTFSQKKAPITNFSICN
jgi:hypothetical protein